MFLVELMRKSQKWELYELISNDGSYVFIPKNYPLAVRTDKWKENGLEWIYTIQAIDQPFALLRHGEDTNKRFKAILAGTDFTKYLSAKKNSKPLFWACYR